MKNKIDLHIHTKWCKHGEYEIIEVVKKRIEQGFKTIAITEHVPLSDNYNRSDRMDKKDLEKYLIEIHEIKNRYKDKIEILIGFECEYLEEELEYYKKIKKDKRVDFLMLGHHFSNKNNNYFEIQSESQVIDYLEEIEKAINENLFLYIAHPDLFLSNFFITKKIDEKLDEFIKNNHKKIIFEINCSGFFYPRKNYPDIYFWQKINTYGAKILINSDAHIKNDFEIENLEKGKEFVIINKLENLDIITNIKEYV